MSQESRRLLIQRKIDAGTLPRDSIQRIWGAYSNADICDGCDEVIRGDEYLERTPTPGDDVEVPDALNR